MSCVAFYKSCYCLDCDDFNCSVNGGNFNPHDMCGCEACEYHQLCGDQVLCRFPWNDDDLPF